jgi:hypothetical protein
MTSSTHPVALHTAATHHGTNEKHGKSVTNHPFHDFMLLLSPIFGIPGGHISWYDPLNNKHARFLQFPLLPYVHPFTFRQTSTLNPTAAHQSKNIAQ